MTSEEIIEGNKLIAEFMNAKPSDLGKPWKEWMDSELEYHSSWDWLMSVVQRISELDYEIIFEIKPKWEESTFSIYDCENNDILVDSFNISREYIPINLIEYVWDECVCFIKWYNNQKKE